MHDVRIITVTLNRILLPIPCVNACKHCASSCMHALADHLDPHVLFLESFMWVCFIFSCDSVWSILTSWITTGRSIPSMSSVCQEIKHWKEVPCIITPLKVSFVINKLTCVSMILWYFAMMDMDGFDIGSRPRLRSDLHQTWIIYTHAKAKHAY